MVKAIRVLAIHNFYQQSGGEDSVFVSESDLLRAYGHEVIHYTEDNRRIDHMSGIRVASDTIWSFDTFRNLSRLLRDTHPDVAHFHNTFPLISPSAYYACRAAGVPVVQTLHNYRLGCPKALLYRNGRSCEDCLGQPLAWRGVLHACYRDNRGATAAAATAAAAHRVLGTWSRMVDVYIALTYFSRSKQIAAGLPAEKIVVKPNFVDPDPGASTAKEPFALFVGRLSPEKAPELLVGAWRRLETPPALTIVGDGPLREEVQREADAILRGGSVRMIGQQPRARVLELMRRARVLVFPSNCYENFPVAIAEAYACGTPVIAARHGAMAELVKDGMTGLLFQPGDSADLAHHVKWAWDHPREMKEMGARARQQFDGNYTAERNYAALLDVYALAQSRQRARS